MMEIRSRLEKLFLSLELRINLVYKHLVMKRTVLILIFLATLPIILVVGQNSMRKGDVNLQEYPNVTFVWHENNPDTILEDLFLLKEGDEELELQVDYSIPDVSNRKSIVILWEDMNSIGNTMFKFSQRVLLDFISSKEENDDFLIATFNRHHRTDKVLNIITNGFVDDATELSNSVENYRHSSEIFAEQPLLSDVFPAINESFELFQKIKTSNDVKAIVVITSGQPLETAATNHVVSIQKNSLDKHIPIYVLQYSPRHGPSTKFESLAHDTYGMYYSCGSMSLNANIKDGESAINNFYSEMSKRYAGVDYELTYETSCKRGKIKQEYILTVRGVEHTDFFISPEHTLGSWIEAYTFWFIVIIIAFIALIVTAIVLPINNKKKRRLEKEEQERKDEKLRKQIEEQEKLRKQEIEQQRIEQENRRKSERMAVLQKLIAMKNTSPTIKYEIDNQIHCFEIDSTDVSIGREDCDIVLNGGTISRKHATISFDGNGFMLEDHSTNGTTVDGVYVKKNIASITNGTHIVIGNVTLIFNF